MTPEEISALDALIDYRNADFKSNSVGYATVGHCLRVAADNLIASRKPTEADVFVLGLGGLDLCDREARQSCFRTVPLCLCRRQINAGLKAVREMTK